MRTAKILAIALLTSPAMATTTGDPSPSERVWRLFPSEVQPYRPGTVPLHLTDRDFAERGDWDNNTAPGTGIGAPGNYRGSNVSISLPTGPRNIREAIQEAIQDFARTIGWGGYGGGDDGSLDASSSSGDDSLSGGGCCSGDELGGP